MAGMQSFKGQIGDIEGILLIFDNNVIKSNCHTFSINFLLLLQKLLWAKYIPVKFQASYYICKELVA